jgi:hypothetical protein
MKLAIFSESEADEAAIRILLDGILGTATERPSLPPLRARGVDAVFATLPAVIAHLYYRTDTDALVVVVDSDRKPLPDDKRSDSAEHRRECRLFRLQDTIAEAESRLSAIPGRAPLQIVAGLAVPQIEAWYLVGRDPHVSEAAWANGLRTGQLPYTGRSLKEQVYGTDAPSFEAELARATAEATRIVSEEKLDSLKTLFPLGFGTLADAVAGW